MNKYFLMLAVLFCCCIGYADTVTVTDVVVPQNTIVVAEHIDYPVWRYTGDSAVKRLDLITIRFRHVRQGGAVIADTVMRWRPIQTGVTADSMKPFIKFNTTR
jgi:hypothetical protein